MNNDKTKIAPFLRAAGLTNVSLYWLAVESFPIHPVRRRWILEFLRLFNEEMIEQRGLRTEIFMQFKSLYPDLLDQFLKTAEEYQPVIGMSLRHGQPPPSLPSMEDIEREVNKGGAVNVNQWMADYCYWFLVKKTEAQWADFLGVGGTCSLYLKPNPNAPPEIDIPRIVRTHPMFQKMDVNAKMMSMHDMEDPFLQKSKEMFGEPLRNDPGYSGLLFVLPLFRCEHFLSAIEEELARWFELFDAYVIESPEDRGMIFAINDPDFDPRLEQMVKQLEEKDLHYRV